MSRKTTRAGACQDRSVTDLSTAQKSQINYDSFADGHCTWKSVDHLLIPCIIRDGKPHGPVRILEKELLNRLSSTNAVNAAFQNRQLLVSKYLTHVEAMQLNYGAGGHFGPFTSKDLVVDIDEFRELYTYVKSVLHNSEPAVTGGWVQVNNSVIPYINVKQSKLLPLPVVMNAAGLLSNVSSRLLQLSAPSEAQCRYFNELCTSAGLDFMFDTKTLLVDINVMCALTIPTPYTRELSSQDPFSHAQFIDERVLGTSASTPAVQSYHISNTVAPHGVLVAQSAGHVVSQPPNVLPTFQPSQMMQQGPVVNNSVQPAPTVIESVPFRGRTISSLRRPSDGNHYVLLEAVCRVFFPHQKNVNAFIRAAETLLSFPAVVQMTADEEQQFISFYKLSIDRLRFNKLIRLDMLTEIFPRFEVLFPAEAVVDQGQLIGTLIPRHPGDSGATADGQTPRTTTTITTTTTTTNHNNNNDDVARPRKRRRNNVCSDVVVID